MTLKELEAQRQQGLAHLNVSRRARDLILKDIQQANESQELVSTLTLDLADHMAEVEHTAVKLYTAACKAVDEYRAQLAGLKVED